MTDQLKYTTKLRGSRVLVLGGSSGIGYGAAEALLEHGAAAVIISSSRRERIDDALSRLRASYPTLSTQTHLAGFPCDLSDDTTLEANLVSLLDFATDKGAAKLDHVITTAGDRLAMSDLSEIDAAFIRRAASVRFTTPLLLGKLLPKYLAEGPASSFVITTGSVGERPHKGWAVVAGYAAGLQGMTRALALELAPRRVNLVSPGGVATELWDMIPQEKRAAAIKQYGDMGVTGGIGRVEDVAQAYVYLMSDRNVTGSMVSTNSGALLKGPGEH